MATQRQVSFFLFFSFFFFKQNNNLEEDKPLLFKLRLLGERQVGKTSLLLQFVDEIFNDNFISTIGLDFKIKTITIQDVTMKFHIVSFFFFLFLFSFFFFLFFFSFFLFFIFLFFFF